VPDADIVFLAVPTPSSADGSCDLSYFEKAVTSLAKHLQGYTIIVNKSTVPVGSARFVEKILHQQVANRSEEVSFDVVSNPEFLKEGAAVKDCLKPDRIIVGISSSRPEPLLKELYAPLISEGIEFLVMDTLSSELTKYAANAMLATRISFMNELSGLCEKVGANIHQVKIGIGSDKRIGPSFLNAGIGYGGSCFPKDIKALQASALQNGVPMPILEAVDRVNQEQKRKLAATMQEYFKDKGGLKGKVIALWGLAFKPETDDMREAPSLDIIAELQEKGALIRAFDPIALETAKKALKDHTSITWCTSKYEACMQADAIALVTEWQDFLEGDIHQISEQMSGRAFFDGRNVFNPEQMRSFGFHYFGIGIPQQTSALQDLQESKISAAR
jgi:UDPglucose 6-dehydrogenase